MVGIKEVQKRDGSIVKFDQSKITNAVYKATEAAKTPDMKFAQKISDRVVKKLSAIFKNKIPSVEEIQDIVVEELLKENKKIAKLYINYRRERAEIREKKKVLFGVYDDLKLDLNATKVLASRYLQKDVSGKIIETPKQMFKRVAKKIAESDRIYGEDVKKSEKIFYEMMSNLEFLPNSPTLMNAGTRLGQLSACFVLPIDDSLESIFETLKYAALIHQSGGGTGFSFSKIRPKGDLVRSTMSIASGPVSFMKIYDAMTETIKQGGRRRGANMGVLRCDHPDIIEFINSKKQGGLKNFNISVAATDNFMKAVQKDDDYELINPRTGEVTKTISAREVFNLVAEQAWEIGDPGLIFIDRINKLHPLRKIGEIEATNPCGEQPLLPYESCNLGSINLTKFILSDGSDFDWDRLEIAVQNAVHFLDNVIDANSIPIREIDQVTKANRKIGLGIMGWADSLILLGIRYDSKEAILMAEKLMRFIRQISYNTSIDLANERGSYPNFKFSIYPSKYKRLRNATLNTIAPTGSLSIIAGVSSGIEPLFAVAYYRQVLENMKLIEINRIFHSMSIERGFYSRSLMEKISHGLSIQKMSEIPRDVRDLFVTAYDIEPIWHLKMQAAFQKYVDNAVSKTINLPYEATVEEVQDIYMKAYELGIKGITIYRYGSKTEQVIYLGLPKEASEEQKRKITVSSEFAGHCSSGICQI
ncbi:MAG: adenosylcobalamin-dependent ribonucleoside-diphosphate reductase [Candidatus Micrarchaeia archaeon]